MTSRVRDVEADGTHEWGFRAVPVSSRLTSATDALEVAAVQPLCFVLMPFGRKSDGLGRDIDFDQMYADVIAPAVRAARMDPIRADEERDGGIIHKPMFERLLLCPYAIADLTLANANVFYELGVRHAVRPHSTLLIHSPGGQRLPFDVAPLRALPYKHQATGAVEDVVELRDQIRKRLEAARDPAADSPLVNLLDGYRPPELEHLKTDVFRDRVRYAEEAKQRLRRARRESVDAIRREQDQLLVSGDLEAGVWVDLLLSFRHASAWQDMVDLVGKMPEHVSGTVLVQEQYGLALNRLGRSEEAATILHSVLERAGPSSETYGLLGRVHKEAWKHAHADDDAVRADGHLERAIDAYRHGFEADWRDAYPGVNLASLLRLKNPADAESNSLLPIVEYAVQRRANSADYWDHATALELAYLKGDERGARQALRRALTSQDVEQWKRNSTADNLRLHLQHGDPAPHDRALLSGLIEALSDETDGRRS